MIRKTITVIALLFVSAACFAVLPSPYLKLNDRCTVIDLAANTFRGHSADATYHNSIKNSTEYGSQYYYHNQNLLSIGMTDTRIGSTAQGRIRLTVTLIDDSDGWFYTLLDDKRFKRPFGLDLFARGRTNTEDVAIPNDGDYYSFHLGYVAPSEDAGYANLFSGNSVEIPMNVVADYSSIWWDVCIVLDPVTDTVNDAVHNIYGGEGNQEDPENPTEYYMVASNQYYVASLQFKIECIDENDAVIAEDTYIVQIYGYYKPADANNMNDNSSVFYLVKNANSEQLDINRIYNDGGWLELASYNFTTNARHISNLGGKTLDNYDAGRVYMFLSSSNNAFGASSEQFTLKRVSGSGSYSSQYFSSINYVVKMESAESNAVRVFDGTLSFSSLSGFDPADCLAIEAEKFRDRASNYARWYDAGTLEIHIPTSGSDPIVSQYGLSGQTNSFQYLPESTDINLNAGTYTSNIYVHIVSDFNI